MDILRDMNSPRMHSLLGFALIFSLLGFAPSPSWADCKNSGGGGASFNYGSEVSGSSVTICGTSTTVVPSRTSKVVKVVSKVVAKPKAAPAAKPKAAPVAKPKAAPVAKPVSKPLPKPAVKPAPKTKINTLTGPKPPRLGKISDIPKSKPMAKPKPIAKPRPIVKPKTIAKPKTKISVKTQVKTKITKTPSQNASSSGSASFSPDETSAGVLPSNSLEVGEVATFVSDPKVHYRLGQVLGKSAEVRFTPIDASWQFADGSTANGTRVARSFGQGSFEIRVVITYAVSYRFSGQEAWIADPGEIDMPDTVQVSVSDSGGPKPTFKVPELARLPYLVSANCLAFPKAIGCF